MSHQLSLSFELICLMDWLIKYGKDDLKLLIKEAVKNNLSEDLESMSDKDFMKISDQLHDIVIDFVIFLEGILIEELEDISPDLSIREKIVPAIRQMDNRKLDMKTVWLSMQQARSAFKGSKKNKKDKNKKEIDGEIKKELFKKLLKNWKPAHNEPMN